VLRCNQARISDFTRADVQSIWNGRRRSSAEGAEGSGVWAPRKFVYFLYQRHLEVTASSSRSTLFGTYFENVLFKKGHPNQKGGCPDTCPWTSPAGSAPGNSLRSLVFYTKQLLTLSNLQLVPNLLFTVPAWNVSGSLYSRVRTLVNSNYSKAATPNTESDIICCNNCMQVTLNGGLWEEVPQKLKLFCKLIHKFWCFSKKKCATYQRR